MGFMDKFKQMAQTAGSAVPRPGDMATMNELQRLNQVGVDTPATIKRLTQTGRTDVGGGVQYDVEVEVQPVGGTPYTNTFQQFMHPGTMGSWAYEGAAVKVKVDPENPSSMVLWGGA